MADKGALSVQPGMIKKHLNNISLTNSGPWYYSNTRGMWAADQSGVISGIVTEGAVRLKDVVVLLYWRPTGALVDKCLTDADGAYEFNGLIPGFGSYTVVAQDPAGGTQYNDQIKALVAPG